MRSQSGGRGVLYYFVYFIVPVVVFETKILFLTISAKAIEAPFEATTLLPDDLRNARYLSQNSTTTPSYFVAAAMSHMKYPTTPSVHVKSTTFARRQTTMTITTTIETYVLASMRTKNAPHYHQTLRSQHQHIARPTIKSSPSATNSTAMMKSHKTDAPMLNYIFDSHLATNKHHHRDRYGPHFDDAHFSDSLMNVTVQGGSVAHLNCRISMLQDKTVSWVKRERDNDSLQLLTVGTQTYSGDARFSVEFQYPNNWRLRIADANKSDEGLYECQISTYPPRVIKTFFRVHAPEVIIADEHGFLLTDKYCQVDSTIQLVCIVRHIAMTTSVVYWLHGERLLNFDMARGGISVKTDLMENGANSTLSIAKVHKLDSGNYTCSIGPNDFYTTAVHVLNGESLAELYHLNGTSTVTRHEAHAHWLLVLGILFKLLLLWY